MLGTIYSIMTRFKLDSREAEQGLDRIGRRAIGVERDIQGVESRLGGLGTALKAVMGAGGVAAFGALAKHVGGLNKELADAEISIATVFSLNKVETFEGGLVRAKKLIGDFRKAAITSPGESRDLLKIFTKTAPSLAKLGLTDSQITTFSSRGLASAFTLMGGDVELASDQLAQILMGQMGADNRLFQAIRNPLARSLGMGKSSGSKQVEDLNKLANSNPKKFFEGLMSALKETDKANAQFSQSFTGMVGSMQENINLFLTEASGPLFQRFTGALKSSLGWLDRNDRKIQALQKSVGDSLAGAWDRAGQAISFVNDNLKLFLLLAGGAAMRKANMALTASAMFGGAGVSPLAYARGYGARAGGYGARVAGVAGAGAVGAGRALRAAPGRALGFAGDLLFSGMFGLSGSRGARAAAAAAGVGSRISSARVGLSAAVTRAGGLGPAALVAMSGLGSSAVQRGRGALSGLSARVGGAVVRSGGVGMAALNLASPLVMGAAGKGFGLAGAALKGLTVGAFKLAGIAAPLGIVIGMIAGTFRVLKDDTNDATNFLKTSFNELNIQLDKIAGMFGQSKANGGFVGGLKRFADWLGTGVVGILGAAVKALELFVFGISKVIEIVKGFAYSIGHVMSFYNSKGVAGLTLSNIEAAFTVGFREAGEEAKKAEYESLLARQKAAAREKSDAAYEKLATDRMAALEKQKVDEQNRKLENANNPNIKVENKITFETEADPDKIAIRLEQITANSIMQTLHSVAPFGGLD